MNEPNTAAQATLVALGDVTPSRGTVLYVGTDRAAAREACEAYDGNARVLTEHPRSTETPSVGERAYHDFRYAWTGVGY